MSVPVGSRHSFPVSSEVELADARGSKSAAERALEADAAAAQRRHEAELAGLRLEAPPSTFGGTNSGIENVLSGSL